MEVQLVIAVQLQPRMALRIHQYWIQVDEVPARRRGTVGPRQGVVMIHLLPERHAVWTPGRGHIHQMRLGKPRPHPLRKLPEPAEDHLRGVRILRLQVVASAIVHHDARRIAGDELLEARQLVPRARAAERTVAHRQRRQLSLRRFPLAEDAAAHEQNAPGREGPRGVLLREGAERRLVLLPTLSGFIGGGSTQRQGQQGEQEAEVGLHQ